VELGRRGCSVVVRVSECGFACSVASRLLRCRVARLMLQLTARRENGF
jgi:hypothetical protein